MLYLLVDLPAGCTCVLDSTKFSTRAVAAKPDLVRPYGRVTCLRYLGTGRRTPGRTGPLAGPFFHMTTPTYRSN
eukprot:SAG31_NODE_15482_length_753_cov_0.784404_1_plen_73_part_10